LPTALESAAPATPAGNNPLLATLTALAAGGSQTEAGYGSGGKGQTSPITPQATPEPGLQLITLTPPAILPATLPQTSNPPAGGLAGGQPQSPLDLTPIASLPTLRSLAQAHGIYIGAAVDPSQIQSDPGLSELLSHEFDMLTPGNAMKFDAIHPEPERYDFYPADILVAYAQAYGMAVRGHTLVWDSQLPAWVTQGNFTREQWKAILHDHIYTVVGHFRGQIYAWDVVNEALDDDGRLRDTIWLRTIGPDYIALAFQWAHEADPQAKLFYNDNGGEGMNQKSQAIYQLVQGLLAAGVPINGVGLQMHVSLSSAPSAQDLAANMKRLQDLGLEVHITEMDVRIQYSSQSLDEKLLLQAQVYQSVFATCLAAPNCKAFVTWGVTDRYSWIPSFTGHPDAPLLFDEAGKPKLAFYSILSALIAK
jgi:endo-1,4-beta-xylanase